jgi:hypothetical protein
MIFSNLIPLIRIEPNLNEIYMLRKLSGSLSGFHSSVPLPSVTSSVSLDLPAQTLTLLNGVCSILDAYIFTVGDSDVKADLLNRVAISLARKPTSSENRDAFR